MVFCREHIPDIEKALQKRIKEDDIDVALTIRAWLLSVSAIADVANNFAVGRDQLGISEFESNRILFLDGDMEYMKVMLEK